MQQQQEEHSKIFPPSGGHRWIACAGSSILIVRLNLQDTAGMAAHIGTVCHDIAYQVLTGKMTVSPLGQTFEGVLIIDKLWNAIKLYCKRVKHISEHVAEAAQIKQSYYEAKVWYDQDCFGTVDAAHLNPSTLYLQDLKMGEGVLVLAEGNEQLKIYSLAALRTLVSRGQPQPYNIINEIVQPLYRDEIPVKTTHLFTKELLEWDKDVLQPAMAKIRTGLAIPFEQPLPAEYFNPGPKQCKWCTASANCNHFAEAATASAAATFQQFVQNPNPVMTQPNTLPAPQVVDVYKKLPLLETFISEVIRHMKHNVGVGNPGFEEFKMVTGLGNSAWVDETAAQSYLRGVAPEIVFMNHKFMSPTQARKLLKDAKIEAPGLDQYITRPPTDPKLTLVTDERPAVNETAQQTFQKVIEQNKGTVEEQKNIPNGGTLPPPATDSHLDMIPTLEWNKKTQKKGGYLHRIRGEVFNLEVPEKRAAVLQYAGQKTIAEVAVLLDCTCSNVKNHIKALNIKNGYETLIHATDGSYEVTLPESEQPPIELTEVVESNDLVQENTIHTGQQNAGAFQETAGNLLD